tara:strand:- start:67 stop:249 length:183 start_codon:yes stop_codon:yes gene_type:complete
MGELVSLCAYRETLKKEKEAKDQEELEQLRSLLDAWKEHLGDPVLEPYFLPLDKHLTGSP